MLSGTTMQCKQHVEYRPGAIVRLQQKYQYINELDGHFAWIVKRSHNIAFYHITLVYITKTYRLQNIIWPHTSMEPGTQEELDQWILQQELTR